VFRPARKGVRSRVPIVRHRADPAVTERTTSAVRPWCLPDADAGASKNSTFLPVYCSATTYGELLKFAISKMKTNGAYRTCSSPTPVCFWIPAPSAAEYSQQKPKCLPSYDCGIRHLQRTVTIPLLPTGLYRLLPGLGSHDMCTVFDICHTSTYLPVSCNGSSGLSMLVYRCNMLQLHALLRVYK
jgi:hypothetical protein